MSYDPYIVYDKLSYLRPAPLERFYYGATYYPEHWSAADREDDVERMVAAGFNMVRMAEFAWDYLEPEPGHYRFDLFDEVIAQLGERGISTMLGTPTATPPRWLTARFPEVLRVNAAGVAMQHGSRQHVCVTSPVFRSYSRRITRAMAEHFADSPYVVGWQTDNELNCHFSECHCPACQTAFVAYLRQRYGGDIDALNQAWGNAFWSLTYDSFDQIPTPKYDRPAAPNPAHMLEYYRFISWSTARFQHEQVEILNETKPEWFVTHNGTFAHIDYRGRFGEDLDFLAYDVYPFFDYDPKHRPVSQAFNLDHARAWSGNFMVPEQQSGPGGQAPYLHDTPEPSEVRRMAYTSIARGADSLLFFRWRTARFGAEQYWCGILDHDNVPRRRYDEVKRMGKELETIGPEILGTSVYVDVGVAAADVDVYDAHAITPFGLPSPKDVAEEVHSFLLNERYAVGCVHPSDDLSGLKAYIIPHWALFNPDWVPNLTAYVEQGGVLVIGARTATKDWQNNVVAETPPGVLRQLAGIRVIEYGRQNAPEQRPLTLRFYPGGQRVRSQQWYEMLEIMPQTRVAARWEGRHLGLKTGVSVRNVGEGAVIYAGTYFTADLMAALLPVIKTHREDLTPLWPDTPEGVQVVLRQGEGKQLWFFINEGERALNLSELPEGTELISGRSGRRRMMLSRNEVVIIKVDAAQDA